jgi:hypothetical protein
MARLKMKVNINDLMLQAAKEMRSETMAMGFSIASNCFEKIAKRACELNDPVLLDILDTLDLITMSSEEREDIEKRLKLISKES